MTSDSVIIGGETIKNSSIQINYEPLYSFLDNLEGVRSMNVLEIAKRSYAFAQVFNKLSESEAQQRIDFLTKQNIKYFTKSENSDVIIAELNRRILLLENQPQLSSEEKVLLQQKQTSSENC